MQCQDSSSCRGMKLHLPVSVALALSSIHLYTAQLHVTYRMAGNFGRKNIWRIALIIAFGGFYFGSWISLAIIIFIAKWFQMLQTKTVSSVNSAGSVSNHSNSNYTGTQLMV